MRRKADTGKVWIWSGTAAIAAALALTGLSVMKEKNNNGDEMAKTEITQEKNVKSEKKKQQTAKKDVLDQGEEQIVREIDIPKEQEPVKEAKKESVEKTQEKSEEETQNVAAIIEAKKQETQPQETLPQDTQVTAAKPTAHFTEESSLQWPVEGKVLQPFSMEATVYFPTLQQYKYNPALLIEGTVNEKVTAAASGKITDISTNEETGCTVTMDIGDGYTAKYGQLKELNCQVGDYMEAGAMIGHVSEPTKYYTEEGANLFFQLQKNDTPIDPLKYLS